MDDDETVLKTVTEYLKSFGYTKVLVARDGEEALLLTQSNPIDFVITDWEMPKLNGIEFLKNLRLMEGFRDIPYIIITSPTSQERLKVAQAVNVDVDAYIIKPFRSSVLKEKIEEVLSKRERKAEFGVLVVDDNDDVRTTITDILKTMGYRQIVQAKNGAEAFELLQQYSILLVISDWEMPELSGIDLLRKIRSDPYLVHIPFLMVTSQTSKESLKVSQAIDAEVDHYLMKPFTVAELKSKVRSVLKKAAGVDKTAMILQKAKLAIGSNDETLAKKFYHEAIQLNPKAVDGYLGLAGLLLQEESKQTSFEEAIQVLKHAIEANPTAERPYLELSSAFENRKSLELAMKYLKEGAQKCPESDQIHCQLGRLYLRVGKSDMGKAEIRRALEINPDNAEALALADE